MSHSFSANQFESTFKSQRLQNWCEDKHFKERPSARVGQTAFIADDNGHLLPGVKRGKFLTNFQGSWDLPARIPHPINPTARSMEGLRRLQSWGFCPPQSAKVPRGSSSTDVGKQTRVAAQQDGADSSHTADARPASQNRPVTGSQNHNPAPSPATQDIQATGKDRPLSQSSAKNENSASAPTAATEAQERPKTREERPQSTISEKRGDRVASSSSSSSRQTTHRVTARPGTRR